MKRVVVFVGSSRKNGNVSTLAAELARGAEEAGAEVKVYDLNALDIQSCRGCFHCRQVENCAIQDDAMQTVYSEIKAADAVVIGIPIYFGHVNARTKLMLERLFPLTGSNFLPRFGRKETVVIYAQGNKDEHAYDPCFKEIADTLRCFGLETGDTLVFTGASIPGRTAGGDGEMLARAYQAGCKLVG